MRKIKLLTKEVEALAARLGSQDGKGGDALVIAKLFHPMSNWTWLATEFEPETRNFFGFVVGFEMEWGSFSLDELESTVVRGLPMERDLSVRGKTTVRQELKFLGREYPEPMKVAS